MAAKIILIAITVMCTFGALNARPQLDKLSVKSFTPNDLVAELEQFVTVAQNSVAQLKTFAAEQMSDAIDLFNDSANDLFDGWNSQIDELAKKATDQGLDITECLVMEKQLPSVVDQVNSQIQKCSDAEQQKLTDAIALLEDFKPRAEAIVEAIKEDVAQCDPNADTAANIKCAISAFKKHEKPTLALTLEFSRQSIKIRSEANNAAKNTFTCISQSDINDVTTTGSQIVSSTVQCIQDKMQN